LKRQRNREIN